MTDPHAPTPGTENEPPWIGYDAIEKLVRDFVRIYGEFRCDLATILALVRKARQRDGAEKEIEAEIDAENRRGYVSSKYPIDGLRFALDALRREP